MVVTTLLRSARRHHDVAVALGALVALVSAAYPAGIDETVWTTIARWVADGRQLYVEAIDNKSPLVFLASWATDIAPGPFPLARALLTGGLVAWLTWAASSMARATGASSSAARLIGAGVGACVAVLGVFQLTTELLAAAALAGAVLAVLRQRPTVGAALALMGLAFDPRSLLLLPGLALLCRRHLGTRPLRHLLAVWATGAAVGGLLVLSNPDLRYALLELNFASRQAGTWRPSEFAAASAASLLPLLVGIACLHLTGTASWMRGRFAVPGLLMALGGVAAAAASLQPFHHYWILPVPWLALILGPPSTEPVRPWGRRLWVIALALAVTPLAWSAVRWHGALTAFHADYAEAVELVVEADPPEPYLISFDQLPFASFYAPDRSALRSPWPIYLFWPSSRRADHLAEVAALLPSTGAIIEDGGLAAGGDEVSEGALPLWDLLRSELDEFGCRVPVGELIVHLRLDGCGPSGPGAP